MLTYLIVKVIIRKCDELVWNAFANNVMKMRERKLKLLAEGFFQSSPFQFSYCH